MTTILNIAAGKIQPLDLKDEDLRDTFIVNVDPMYISHDDPEKMENLWKRWIGQSYHRANVKMDAFEFMERTIINFDRVCIYRFLEHVSFTQVMYFIYLVSMVTERHAIIDVIVPNYNTLAQLLLNENPTSPVFEEHNILLTTELLNEPSCPHASIWTPDRAYHFWEMEGRFKVENMETNFKFDGRDIYLRFQARRL